MAEAMTLPAPWRHGAGRWRGTEEVPNFVADTIGSDDSGATRQSFIVLQERDGSWWLRGGPESRRLAATDAAGAVAEAHEALQARFFLTATPACRPCWPD